MKPTIPSSRNRRPKNQAAHWKSVRAGLGAGRLTSQPLPRRASANTKAPIAPRVDDDEAVVPGWQVARSCALARAYGSGAARRVGELEEASRALPVHVRVLAHAERRNCFPSVALEHE